MQDKLENYFLRWFTDLPVWFEILIRLDLVPAFAQPSWDAVFWQEALFTFSILFYVKVI